MLPLAMQIVDMQNRITLKDLEHMATGRFGDLVKAVVDLERALMVVDAEMHADEEAELLGSGSRQVDLWGINLYPELPEADWIEFDSMINLRPSFGNRSRGVDDPQIRHRIILLVQQLVDRS
jgi:hypothetical protein